MAHCQRFRSANSRRLVRKLSAYTAAGASLMRTDVSGAIIHTDFRDNPMAIVNDEFDVDLNHDGVLDASLMHQAFEHSCIPNPYTCMTQSFRLTRIARLQGFSQNEASADTNGVAINFAARTLIDPLLPSAERVLIGAYIYRSFTTYYGVGNTSYKEGWIGAATPTSNSFYIPARGFLGMAFDIPGSGRHAAWLDLQVGAGVPEIRLFGFAYETEPGKPIRAGAVPEPPSLVLLAAGAAGLAVLRMKRAKHQRS